MGRRIRSVSSPVLTVDSAGTGFDEPTLGNSQWSWDSSTGAVYTPLIDGEIIAILLNFGASNTDSSANLTVKTRDTPQTSILSLNAIDWTSDATYCPLKLATTNAGAALTVTGNTYIPYWASGSLEIDCAAATDNDTLEIKIYYR